jgi:hypothetical protein
VVNLLFCFFGARRRRDNYFGDLVPWWLILFWDGLPTVLTFCVFVILWQLLLLFLFFSLSLCGLPLRGFA